MDVDLLKNIKILIVDDEPSIQEILSEELYALGAHVKTATSGQQALEILKKERFQIVITDSRMPQGDGIFLLKSIQEQLEFKPLCFICSGFVKLTPEQLKELNVTAILGKPFSIIELFKVLPFPIPE